MRWIYVVTYGGAERQFGEVSGVFETPKDARDHWEFVTRDLGTDKHYSIERWPVGGPLYPNKDYFWPPDDTP